jgi:hypothetical protein
VSRDGCRNRQTCGIDPCALDLDLSCMFFEASRQRKPRLCMVCHTRPAEVPDREAMGRPIKKVCGQCHGGRLALDVVAVIGTTSRSAKCSKIR